MRRIVLTALSLAVFTGAGNQLLAQPAPTRSAQNAGQSAAKQKVPGFNGIVLKVMDSSFVLVDKAGNLDTIKIGSQTSFQMRKTDAGVRDVIKFGMVLRGAVDADGFATQVSGSHYADQMTVAQLKVFLEVSDSEWTAISAKIDQVRAARHAVSANSGNGNGNGNGNATPDNGGPTVGELQNSLASLYFEQGASSDRINRGVEDLRKEKAKARANLETARKELVSILTPKQEALLVIVGVLD